MDKSVVRRTRKRETRRLDIATDACIVFGYTEALLYDGNFLLETTKKPEIKDLVCLLFKLGILDNLKLS